MRKGYHGFYGLVRNTLGSEVRTGHLSLYLTFALCNNSPPKG
jgi:hypothetical protein